MTGILRYIYWIMGFILILNVSCNDNEKVHSGDDQGNQGEEEVEFILAASPRSYSTTREPGSISERTIRELDILVVKDGLYQYRREAIPATDSYRTTLMVDDGLTLYFIVNSRSMLENCSELVVDNRWEEDIRPALIMADPEGLVGPDVLPMWGVKENVAIVEGEINQLDDIFLLRSVASVDIYNAEDPEVFTLQEAYLYFVPDKGYLAPSDSNYDTEEQDVLTPLAPDDMQNYAMPLFSDNVLNETILYQLYLYENDAVSSMQGTKRYSRVVVGGSYKGGETTYYPVDLLDDDLKTILQATRNYKYAILIGSVKSPGYPDPGTASESADARIEYDVIEWNQKDEKELVFDGPFYISIESKKVYLYKPAGSSDDLEMTTNIATEDLTMEFIDSGNGTVYSSEDGYTIWNDRFRVELVFDDNNQIEAVRFTALQPYNASGSNLDAIRIYSNRVTVQIDIEQLNESPTQWIDGGQIGVDIDTE